MTGMHKKKNSPSSEGYIDIDTVFDCDSSDIEEPKKRKTSEFYSQEKMNSKTEQNLILRNPAAQHKNLTNQKSNIILNSSDPNYSSVQKEANKFIFLLHQVVSSPEHPSISWSDSGKSIIIHDRQSFLENSLPQFSKTTEYAGFIRQLNGYGFRKQIGQKTEYKCQGFEKGREDLLWMMKRKKKDQNNKILNSNNNLQVKNTMSLIPTNQGTWFPEQNTVQYDPRYALQSNYQINNGYLENNKISPVYEDINTQLARMKSKIESQDNKIEKLTEMIKELLFEKIRHNDEKIFGENQEKTVTDNLSKIKLLESDLLNNNSMKNIETNNENSKENDLGLEDSESFSDYF